uniref:F-box domain-containing protein n=1 Tax=Heterorhabditis bacteriophora TaxID=37862 RepID=A0A1I7WZF1_HETBA
MSLGSLSLLPPELIRHICYDLSLDDVIKLQRCEYSGASITLLAPSISKRTFVTTTSSDIWKNVIYKSEMIEQVIITKSEDAKDFTILDYISKSGKLLYLYFVVMRMSNEDWLTDHYFALKCALHNCDLDIRNEYRIRQLDIILRAGERPVSPMKRNQSYRFQMIYRRLCLFNVCSFQKLTSFMSVNRKWLQEFRLETDPDNIIEFIVKNQDAVLRYAHDNDSMLQQTLIVPIFHAMMIILILLNMQDLHLLMFPILDIDFSLMYKRYSTFSSDFGFNVSTLSHAEIQQVLSQYAPYLNDTRNLQHLIVDLSHSTVRRIFDVTSRLLLRIVIFRLCNLFSSTLASIFFHRSSIRSSIGPRSYGMALWCRAYGLGVEAQDRVRSVSRTNRNNSHHNSCLCLTTFTIAPKSFTGQKKKKHDVINSSPFSCLGWSVAMAQWQSSGRSERSPELWAFASALS